MTDPHAAELCFLVAKLNATIQRGLYAVAGAVVLVAIVLVVR